MNKDNLVFAVFGILVGFIAGYLVHEVIAVRQPPRLTPELRAQIAMPGEDPMAGPADNRVSDVAPGAGGDTAASAPGGAPGGAGPAPASMEEVQQLRAYVEQNPNDADAVLRLANLNFDIRNWMRAEELYRQYLKLRPGDANVMTDLGISYRESKKFDEALAQFDQAQKIAPDHWQSYYNEVVVLAFDLKRFDDADRVLAELQRLQPGNPDVARLADAVSKQRSAA
jgi:cytochrome c-type biogenesis protein CcmH/NrfG